MGVQKLDIGDNIPDISDGKSTNRENIENMYDAIGEEFGSFLLSRLEDKIEDVSEWLSDLAGVLGDLGTTFEEAAARDVSRAVMAIVASANNWSTSDYYTRDLCEEFFDVAGPYSFEKRVKKECIASFEPKTEEKIDEAHDDW